jgi:cell division protein FtsW (lipid II flippase)
MLVCANKECANYKLELEDNTELCPLCGTTPEKKKAKNNPTIGVLAIVAVFVGFLIMWSVNVAVGCVIAVLGLGASFLSKSKAAIFVAFLIAVLMAGVLILFLKPF